MKMQLLQEWLKAKHVGQAFQPAIHWPELRSFSKEDLGAVGLYQRRLPHWELEGSTYFVTFRVQEGMGRPLVGRLENLAKPPHSDAQTGRLESLPHTAGSEVEWGRLSSLPSGQPPSGQPPCSPASIVEEALWFGYEERYLLDAYVIMPDHVHLLLRPLANWRLAKILQGIKGFTAREINRVLGRRGSFWQDESFDHLVRDEGDWVDKFEYIHNNPVSAGLVERPEDYPFSSLVTMHSRGRLESLKGKLESINGRLESLPHIR